MSKVYGIYSTVSKKFVFGIMETSKRKAEQKLFDKIGKGSYKWRFKVREISPKTMELIKSGEYGKKKEPYSWKLDKPYVVGDDEQ